MYTFRQLYRFPELALGTLLALITCSPLIFAQTPTIPTPAEPKIAIVLNSAEASVSLIDMQTRKVIKTTPVGKEPHHLMLTPDQKTLLIANAAGNDVQLMNPVNGELLGKIPEIIDPYQIGYSPNHKWFIANGNRLDRVDIYAADGANLKLAKSIKLAKTPSHIAYTSDSKTAFITLQDSSELAAIDLATQTVIWKMPTGNTPAGLWMTPGDQYLLVGITGEDNVQVIDWKNRKEVKRIFTGKGAHNFRPLGDKKHVFLSNRVAATISLLNMQTLEKEGDITGLPSGPDDMEITPDGKTMWVTFRFAKKVGVIDIPSMKLIATIPVGKSPHGVFFTPRAAWE
ncbi:beta-propeller fold lactonase family protein [Polynucleobacter sp. Latsch14-2]|jgi:YVTN family beta-propeller protein|uniref:YVTN family beta-propeller repeat protein n=1 Tax=Polynucleobacter sp. Latsch14-2 TaxID=2576920 RepID=UPI001C0E262C|nr:cytochrome D1 domain-containing protein [Polynucleobacter sp. Latsch14-2]MBU3614667.1 beta-propeller fold lactonase family protein [Polynucleobacter sp. Latsch14-2]